MPCTTRNGRSWPRWAGATSSRSWGGCWRRAAHRRSESDAVNQTRGETSMPKIVPFLWFDTQALEAAKFYVSVFKGPKSKILDVSRYGETGPGPKGGVMVVDFQLDGQRVQALNGGPHFSFSPAVSVSITCKTQKEIDGYWKKLLAGGGQESQCG